MAQTYVRLINTDFLTAEGTISLRALERHETFRRSVENVLASRLEGDAKLVEIQQLVRDTSPPTDAAQFAVADQSVAPPTPIQPPPLPIRAAPPAIRAPTLSLAAARESTGLSDVDERWIHLERCAVLASQLGR